MNDVCIRTDTILQFNEMPSSYTVSGIGTSRVLGIGMAVRSLVSESRVPVITRRDKPANGLSFTL